MSIVQNEKKKFIGKMDKWLHLSRERFMCYCWNCFKL